MPIFRENIELAVDLLGRQCSVSLTSVRGGGRTWFCRKVHEKLELSGRRVYWLSGTWALRQTPFGAMGSEIAEIPPPTDFHRFAQSLARSSLDGQPPIVIIDDAHLLDSFSVALIENLRSRVEFSTLVSYPTSVKVLSDWPPPDRQIIEGWSDVGIQLSPLPFESVSELASHYLGGPVSTQLAGRLFAMGAGNPLITTDILRTARWANLLAFRQGVWLSPSENLWTPQLHRIAEAYLQELDVNQRELLLALAIAGPMPYGELTGRLGSDRLLELEQAGFITLLDGEEHGAPVVMATPGLLAEYLRRAASPVTQQRVSAMADELLMRPALDELPHQLIPTHQAALVEHFQDEGARQIATSYSRWRASPSSLSAASLIAALHSHYSKTDDILEFVQQLRADAPDDDVLLKCVMLEADLLAYRLGQADAAITSLEEAGRTNPALSKQTTAYALLVEAMTNKMPADYVTILEGLLPQEDGPDSTVALTVLSFLLAIDYRPQDALNALERVDRVLAREENDGEFPQLSALRLITRALALQELDKSEEALDFCIRSSEEARAKFDRTGMIASAYASMLSALSLADWSRVQTLLGEVVGILPGGLATTPYHAPLVRMAASAAAAGGQHSAARGLFAEVKRLPGPQGPLVGQHEEFFLTTERLLEDPEHARRYAAAALSRSGERYLERGYLHSAYVTFGASAFTLPSQRVLSRISEISALRSITAYEDLWQTARAVAERDWDELKSSLQGKEPTPHARQLVRLLHTALSIEQSGDAEQSVTSMLDGLIKEFGGSDTSPAPRLFGKNNFGLSAREKEVGLLTASLSNAEIAERLGISTRTVEKHISNALHKLGVTDRYHLYQTLRGSA